MKRREKVKHEGERRSIFLRYLGEVATADVLLGEDGKPVEEDNFGDNVIIVA
jgi:hypothetical protein